MSDRSNTIRPVLRYPGGKGGARAINQIKAYFPSQFGEFREAFCGSAALTLSVDSSIPRWINDLNAGVVAVHLALRDRWESFVERCEGVAPASPDEPMVITKAGECIPLRLWELFFRCLEDADEDLAFRFLYLNRVAMHGRVFLEPAWRHRTRFTNLKGWSSGWLHRLRAAGPPLLGVRITNWDFESVLREPGTDVLVYCDCPYLCDSLRSKSAQLYECSFSMIDHLRLREAVSRCPHKVMLSYDDHPVVRNLYRDLHIYDAAWTYSLRTNRSDPGKELVITNYALDGNPGTSTNQNCCVQREGSWRRQTDRSTDAKQNDTKPAKPRRFSAEREALCATI